MTIQTTSRLVGLPYPIVRLFGAKGVRYRCCWGGRGSGKTRSFAKMAAIYAYNASKAGRSGVILCAREHLNSLEDSSFREVAGAINSEDFLAAHFEIGDHYIKTKDGRVSFVFAGLRRNIDSIKSKANILVAWVDEAENVSELAWQKLLPTVREDDSEIWVTWNPESPNSATHLRWRKNPPKNAKIVKLNFDQNPFFPSVLNQERLNDKELRPWLYKHVWEGDFIQQREGALWSYKVLEGVRADPANLPEMQRIVVAIDPAVTANENSDETGIVVAGRSGDNFFVLDDASFKASPDGWSQKAVSLYHKYEADLCVAEVNNGGDLVQKLIRIVDRNVNYRAVRASRGKMIRAEPVAALYEQGRVFHAGYFPQLEEQMCSFTGDGNQSPDRMDAMVWALTELSTSTGQVYWRIS